MSPKVPFALLVLSIGLVLTLVVQRPRAGSPLFWSLTIAAILAGAGSTIISRKMDREESRSTRDWNSRLLAKVDIFDFEDDGHLSDYFSAAEREQLIRELDKMPLGSRSLRKAISIVGPELLDEKTA